jgi:hypothetical protein
MIENVHVQIGGYARLQVDIHPKNLRIAVRRGSALKVLQGIRHGLRRHSERT